MKAKINKIITLFFVLIVASVGLPFAVANAAPISQFAASGCSSGASILPRWYDGLCNGNDIKGPNDMGSSDTATNLSKWLTIIALNIVQILLTIVGYVSIGYIIYGGFKYMTQGDSSGGTVAARKTIQNAVIGLVLSIMSVAIIKFVSEHIV